MLKPRNMRFIKQPHYAPRLRETLLSKIHPDSFSNVAVNLHQAVHRSIPHLRVKTKNFIKVLQKCSKKLFLQLFLKVNQFHPIKRQKDHSTENIFIN